MYKNIYFMYSALYFYNYVLHFTTTMISNLVRNLYLLVAVNRLRATTTTNRV